MKPPLAIIFLLLIQVACNDPKGNLQNNKSIPIEGTWQLIAGILVENSDTTVTDYTKGQRMIKIINATHFAFLNHDLNKGTDSLAVFVAGGGRYSLDGNHYTEYLDYCSDRNWEGNTFPFVISLQNDTLTQKGIEKIEDAGVERLNIEKYVRINLEISH
jgi:hypothetical protein